MDNRSPSRPGDPLGLTDDLDLVVVIDLTGHQSRSLARFIRAEHMYCEIWPGDTPSPEFEARNVQGVIIAVPPTEVDDEGRILLQERLSSAGIRFMELVQRGQPLPAAEEARLMDFLRYTCGCRAMWTAEAFIDSATERIRRLVGQGRVLSALSGGVDSSVASALVHRAIGDQLVCIFVDHGLMRKGEPEQVIETFRDRFGERLIPVDAGERFLTALAGVADPEAKRKIIGEQFIRIFEEEATRLGTVDYLLQGTLYTDVIESGVGGAAVKSHHNVGGLPEEMDLDLLEPLRFLFKDEVRAVGEALGLPAELVWRQPFPGPGLAIRIIGDVDAETVAIARDTDAIVVEEIDRAGLAKDVWQYFAVITKTRAVGVGEAGRTYGRVAAIRAVQDSDGLTASWARLPHALLHTIATRIMQEVPDVARVVYDISDKPPATIEWE